MQILRVSILVLGVLLFSVHAAAEDDPRAAYLERAALSWMYLPNCNARPRACQDFERREGESVEAVRARIAEVAGQVSRATGDTRMGLVLMSLAFHESRFRGYVDDGRCNDAAWVTTLAGAHLTRLGDCDNGHAYSLWQVHPATREQGAQMIAQRPFAIEQALGIARASLARDGTLRGYTGETDPAAPKAFRRLRAAEMYLLAHPPAF